MPFGGVEAFSSRYCARYIQPKTSVVTALVVSMAHSYDVGTRAWQPDPTEGWIASEVEKKTVEGDKVRLLLRLANGEVMLQIHGYFP